MAFTDMKDKAIPQPDPIAAQDSKFVKDFREWGLTMPHPGFGRDPNIMNEFGHTIYPKWVKTPNGERVVVNNKEEEAKATSIPEDQLRQDGPTIQQYVEHGYDPNTYPPKGFAKRSSDEEIKHYIEAHNKADWGNKHSW